MAKTQFSSITAANIYTDDAVAVHAALTATHGASGAIVGTTNPQLIIGKNLGADTVLNKADSNLEGGQLEFQQADNDKVQAAVWFDRYDGDVRFFRNDPESSATLITTDQFGAGGPVSFDVPDLLWRETKCDICEKPFVAGDKLTTIVKGLLTRRNKGGSIQDVHTITVPICKACFLDDTKVLTKPRDYLLTQQGEYTQTAVELEGGECIVKTHDQFRKEEKSKVVRQPVMGVINTVGFIPI